MSEKRWSILKSLTSGVKNMSEEIKDKKKKEDMNMCLASKPLAEELASAEKKCDEEELRKQKNDMKRASSTSGGARG